jgi:hypothetical protein
MFDLLRIEISLYINKITWAGFFCPSAIRLKALHQLAGGDYDADI